MADITLGATYRDPQTGIEGVAVAVTHFQYGCARVTIEWVKPTDGDVEELTFDEPRLVLSHWPERGMRSNVVHSDPRSAARVEEPGGGFLRSRGKQ